MTNLLKQDANHLIKDKTIEIVNEAAFHKVLVLRVKIKDEIFILRFVGKIFSKNN